MATKFKYQSRSAAGAKAAAEGNASKYYGWIKAGFKVWTPTKDFHRIRILPPTYPDPKSFGLRVVTHGNVGPEGITFLCREAMLNEPDPVEEQLSEARRTGQDDEKWIKEQKAKVRVPTWMIDREHEDDGPQIYPMAEQTDTTLNKASYDTKTNSIIEIEEPDIGFDVELERREEKSRKGNFSWTVFDVTKCRRSTPISENIDEQDEWLQYIQDHPLNECLHYHSYDEIAECLRASASTHGSRRSSRDQTRSEMRGGDSRRGRDDRSGEQSRGMAPSRVESEYDRQGDDGEVEPPRQSTRRRVEPEPEPEPEPAPRSRRRVEPEPEPAPRSRRRSEPEQARSRRRSVPAKAQEPEPEPEDDIPFPGPPPRGPEDDIPFPGPPPRGPESEESSHLPDDDREAYPNAERDYEPPARGRRQAEPEYRDDPHYDDQQEDSPRPRVPGTSRTPPYRASEPVAQPTRRRRATAGDPDEQYRASAPVDPAPASSRRRLPPPQEEPEPPRTSTRRRMPPTTPDLADEVTEQGLPEEPPSRTRRSRRRSLSDK